ncbi:META domain-containing protein [Sphingomonas donggukensis]|uniref:META domain-containing protein n=1 Tax=Sphingomonas donggukensis TaxID=2949093 RepID=A0ABY4TVY0_9SPHN|nr:META domain-containing protein [Sphingomonas donggukensis]URW76477.1 META domain-containing protein [Sphingomonas donggukensis]
MKSVLLIVPALLAAAPAAAQPAAPYRAIGTEPFWSLSIDRRTITYRPAEGRSLTVAKPRSIVGINGELYRARGMTVDITHVRCSDGMSDRTYRDTVRVTIGRRTLNGCGGGVVANDTLIADTRWTIAAVDGRPVRTDRPATMAFTADRIQGRICNSFNCAYRFDRGTLTTDRIVSTRMACIGPAGAVEDAVFRALAQPLKVHRGSADTLVLSNGRASVTLRRAR